MMGAKFQEKMAGQFKDAADKVSGGLVVLMVACLLLTVSAGMLYAATRQQRGDN